MEIVLGDIIAKLKLETSGFGPQMQGAQQRIQELRQQLQQLQPALSGLPFNAVQNAIDSFSRATLNAGNNQAALRQAIAQAQTAMQQFGTTTTASGQTVDKFGQQLSTTTSTHLRQFAAGIQQAQAELKTLQQFGINSAPGGASGGGGILQTMLGVAGGIGIATGITGITSALLGFGKSVITVGASLEQLRITFSAIAGDAAAGARQFQMLTEIGQRLGFSITALADGWRGFSAAARQTNLTSSEIQRTFEGVATAGRAMGASQQQVHSALLALEQMVSKGTVSMEELRRQLGNALPGAFQLAAKAMGVTTEELTRMVTAGEVRGVPFVKAFGRLLLEEFGGAAQKASQTAAAGFARFTNEILLLKDAIAQSGILNFVAALGNALIDPLKKIRELGEARALLARTQGEEAVMGTGVRTGALAPDQLSRLQTIRTLSQQLQGQIATGGPMQPMREERLAQLQMEMQQILESAKATTQQATAQANVTEEARKTRTERERDADALEQIRKQITDVGTVEERFRAKAAQMPGFFGKPTGTADEIRTYNQALMQELNTSFDTMGGLLGARPKGAAPLPDDIAQGIARLSTEYKGLEDAIAKATEKEQALTRAAREAETARAKALRDAEAARALVPTTQADLGRLQTFLGRADESEAEQARSRIIQQGAQLQAMAEKEMLKIQTALTIPVLEPAVRSALEASLVGFEEGLAGLAAQTTALGEAAANAKLEEKFVTPLRAIAAAYGDTKEARDADTASIYAASLAGTQYEDEATRLLKNVQDSAKVLATVPGLRRQAASSALAFDQSQTSHGTVQKLQDQLDQLQVPQGAGLFGASRLDVRLRQKEDATILPADKAAADALRAQITAQEHLNYAVQLFEGLGQTAAQSWISGLEGIVDGTKTVAGAFRDMARAILQSLAQIAAQEGFKALFRLGAGLLTSALGAGVGGGPAAGAGGGYAPVYPPATLFASGGVVNRPTFALLGEDASTAPETIMTRQQMAAMRAAPSAGGQAMNGNGGISIINVGSRQEAERQKSQQEALGRQVVINYVLDELSKGEGSQISRTLRTLQR